MLWPEGVVEAASVEVIVVVQVWSSPEDSTDGAEQGIVLEIKKTGFATSIYFKRPRKVFLCQQLVQDDYGHSLVTIYSGECVFVSVVFGSKKWSICQQSPDS